MKIKSALLTQMSGSIGGMTGAHNRGGLYLRARAIPVDTATIFQQQVRSAFTELVNEWTNILTPAQRVGWNLYGENVLVTDALGDPRPLSGQNWYIACNTPRIQATTKLTEVGIPKIQDAPIIYDRGDFSTPAIDDFNSTDGLTLILPGADPWQSEPTAAIMIYQGRPQNPSRDFFKGPWRLIGGIAGAMPPVEDITITAQQIADRGWPLEVGQVFRWSIAVTQADGRLSTRRIMNPLQVAT